MTMQKTKAFADEKDSVAAVYEDGSIAKSYLDKRMRFSWQRLLHDRQVEVMNDLLAEYRPGRVLEVAPGPARLATELKGVRRGTMLENSKEMVAIAQSRLAASGMSEIWTVLTGDAFALDQAVEASAFDLAYTFRFLRHFRDAERFRLYAMLRSALAPGGLLAFDVVGAEMFERVERRNKEKPADEISIYDVCYTEDSFRKEMHEHGFDVVKVVPVVRHFDLQSLLSYKLEDVAPRMTEGLVGLLEMLPSSTPLEWVAICKKSK